MDENDKLPKEICSDCLSKLKDSFEFREQIEKVEEILRLAKVKGIKAIEVIPGKFNDLQISFIEHSYIDRLFG